MIIFRLYFRIVISVFILFLFSPFAYSISFESAFVLFLFLIIPLLFLFWLPVKKLPFDSPLFELDVSRNFVIMRILSIISIVLDFIKFSRKGFDFSSNFISESTNIRTLEMVNEANIGTDPIGILASVFNGFPLLYVVAIFYNLFWLKQSMNKFDWFIILAALIATLLSGGRNGFFIFILLIFIVKQLPAMKYRVTRLKRFKSYMVVALITVITLVIFNSIFLERAVSSMGSIDLYLNYFIMTNPVGLSKIFSWILSNISSDYLGPFFLWSMYHEYICHGFYEFHILISNHDTNVLYMGAYNFYPFTTLSNRIFDVGFTEINEILKSIPNPGRYLTLFGALFIDFGILGSYIFWIIILLLFLNFWNKMCSLGRFSDLLFVVYLSAVILTSPIYGLIGTANFPGFLFAVLVYRFFFTSWKIKTK